MTRIWDNIKAWFKRSEVVFLARLEAATGFVIAVVSAMDWSPLLNLGMDAGMSLKQGVILGSFMFVKGVVTEWARRRNTIEVDSQLVPTSIVKEVKTEVVTDLPPVVIAKVETIEK